MVATDLARTPPVPCHMGRGYELFNVDFLEWRASRLFDGFVTDPPYSRAGGARTGRSSTSGAASDIQGSDQFWLYWFRSVMKRLTESVRARGCGFVFCDYRTAHLIEQAVAGADTGWTMTQCLVWDRESIGLGSPFRASHELIAFCRGPQFVWDGSKSISNVIRYRWPYGEHKHHPTEKPVGLLKMLVEWAAPNGGSVLDPFAGSGSTLVAALQAGRRVVGTELSEDHYRTAQTRLMQQSMALLDAPGIAAVTPSGVLAESPVAGGEAP